MEDYRWLVSDAAGPWLQRASEELAIARGPSPALLMRLRKDLTAERARLIVDQAALRRRAHEKFSLAERMYFTRKGLEQATDEVVATYKASRFPAGSLADLCCGIGGDLLALAQRGNAIGFDTDDVTRLLAEANADAWGFARDQCRALAHDATQAMGLAEFSGWHCDPDRRVEGRRTTQGDDFQPPLDALTSILGRLANGAIKVAPATPVPANWQQNAELEWLGSRGECRQQVAWFGALARHPGRRSATIVDALGGPRTIVGTGEEPVPTAAGLGRFLYEPHNTVLAAKLTGVLCGQHALAAAAPGIAYLTSDSLVTDAAMSAFEVLELLPFDQKQLKAWCREHGIGQLEIKKRGVDLVPDTLRKALLTRGDASATFIVLPLAGSVKVAVVGRVALSCSRSNRD